MTITQDERDCKECGGANALIREAARLIEPAEGEAVFYIRVGGERTHMSVKTKGEVDPDIALQNAIAAIEGERKDLSNCPVHSSLPAPDTAGTPTIDLDAEFWRSIKEAAEQSPWIPREHYFMNDWVSDVCSFLREPQPPATDDGVDHAVALVRAAVKVSAGELSIQLDRGDLDGQMTGPWLITATLIGDSL